MNSKEHRATPQAEDLLETQIRAESSELLRVGELAKAVNKTVRAVHLYEELGLVTPTTRTEGGFRLYSPDAIARIGWIVKLQAIGFTLAEIRGFVRDFETASSARVATARVREVFSTKLAEIRDQITQLQVIDNDLCEAIQYLDSCDECLPSYTPTECTGCEHQGHERGAVPSLFAVLSKHLDLSKEMDEFDVSVTDVRKNH